MFAAPQEAWADERVCVCPPAPDTPENTLCSRVEAGPAKAVSQQGDRGRVSALCHSALRKKTDGHALDQGLSFEQASLWPLPCVFSSYLSLIFFEH